MDAIVDTVNVPVDLDAAHAHNSNLPINSLPSELVQKIALIVLSAQKNYVKTVNTLSTIPVFRSNKYVIIISLFSVLKLEDCDLLFKDEKSRLEFYQTYGPRLSAFKGRFDSFNFEVVKFLSKVTNLYLTNRENSDPHVESIAKHCPELRRLDLLVRDKVSLGTFVLLDQCRKIDFLKLRSTKFTGQLQATESDSFPALTELEMTGCEGFDNSLIGVLSAGQKLKSVNLRNSKPVDDKSVELLARSPLKVLNLINCSNVTDKGIAFLNGNRTLEVIRLNKNSNLTDATLEVLSGCWSLKSIDIKEVEKITSEAIEKFQKKHREVKVIR